MIKSVVIDGLFNQENKVNIPLTDRLTILTGDNGSGKTTFLNLIFSILNTDFNNLLKIEFSSIVIELDILPEKNKVEKIVSKIIVNKEDDTIITSYYLTNRKKYSIKIIDNNFFGIGYKLIHPQSKEKFSIDKNWHEYGSLVNSVDELIEENKELSFINFLKQSLIYFPTYRRIENDLIELIEQNYNLNYDKDFEKIRKKLDKSSTQNRIVGISDSDIQKLFQTYSDHSRKLNSEGLDKTLKNFIKELIKSTTENEHPTSDRPKESKMYTEAADQLLDLSKNLGIEDINEQSIKTYFEKQEQAMKLSKKLSGKMPDNLSFKLSVKEEKNVKIDQKKNKEFGDLVSNLIMSSIFSFPKKDSLILGLINLYDQHIKSLSTQIQPYEKLKISFKEFFKDKIELSFDNYNLKLSKDFKKLSTGEKQLIILIAYIALVEKGSYYKPLIIIDEPELSLHISWQIKLIKNLLNISDGQYLLATHSPYIANRNYSKYVWQIGDIDAD